jgi:hypothetical protein
MEAYQLWLSLSVNCRHPEPSALMIQIWSCVSPFIWQEKTIFPKGSRLTAVEVARGLDVSVGGCVLVGEAVKDGAIVSVGRCVTEGCVLMDWTNTPSVGFITAVNVLSTGAAIQERKAP